MPLPYKSVRELYDTLYRAGVTKAPLSEWAAAMNENTGTTNYQSGVNDNFIKRASYGIDSLLEATGLPDAGAALGRNVGEWVGDGEAGAEIGRSLPRSLVNFAPLALSAIPGVGAPVGLGLSGLLAGADAYTQTDSPLSGILSGGITAAMPGAARFGEQAALRLLQGEGGRIAGNILTKGGFQGVNEFIPRTISEGLISQGAGQATASVLGEGQRMLEAGLSDDVDYDFSPTRALLEMTLGQAPFAGMYALRGGREQLGGAASQARRSSLQADIERTKTNLALADAKKELDNTPPVAKPPPQSDALTKAKTEKLLLDIQNRVTSNDARIDALRKEATPEALDELSRLEREDDAMSFDEGYRRALEENGVEEVYNRSLDSIRKRKGIDPELNPELPVGPEVIPDLVHQRKFKEAQDRITNAKSTKDLADAFDDANQVLERLGMTKIQRSTIEAKRKELEGNATPPTEGEIAMAVVNDAKNQSTNQLKVLRDKGVKREEARQFVQAQEAEVKSMLDEDNELIPGSNESLVAEMNNLNGLKEAFANQGGRASQLVETGEVDRIYLDWVNDGRKGGFDTVRTRLLEARRTGAGLPGRIQKSDLENVVKDYTAQDELQNYTELAEEYGFLSEWELAIKNKDKKAIVQLMNEIDLAEKEAVAPAPSNVGGGFTWSLVDYNPTMNKLGKHTLPKTGLLKVSQFKNMANRDNAGPVPDAEVDFMREVVPEAFEGENINVPVLFKGLEEKGPVVEVKKLGGTPDPKVSTLESQRLLHELDTRFPGWQERNDIERSPAEMDLVSAYEDAWNQGEANRGATNRSRYSFLGPKSEQDMPGYVEGLVRLPDANVDLGGGVKTDTAYTGPHFGSEDKNVLAFFRGYEETLPSGEKAFHVIEVQSDWGQDARKSGTSENNGRAQITYGITEGHPLLRVYESLALKAAINHAKEIGATKLILSDGETAMMTEGHDKVARMTITGDELRNYGLENLVDKLPKTGDGGYYLTPEIAAQYGIETKGRLEPSQSAGMRLHYDQTLPSALKKLTGVEGERVELGNHKSAIEVGNPRRVDLDLFNEGNGAEIPVSPDRLVGSPVFRNPDGTPKSSITGRAYDISSLPRRDAQGGDFTLGGRAAAPRGRRNITPFVPTDDTGAAWVQSVGDSGVSLYNRLLASTDPAIAKVMPRLQSFMDAIERIGVQHIEGRSETHGLGGNVTVRLNAALRNASPWAADKEMAHELLHGITLHELHRPTNAEHVVTLGKLRERVAQSLPKPLKDVLNKAVDNEWYSGWANGTKTWGELFDGTKTTKDDQNLIYGLLNNDEFISQAYSDSSMQEFLTNQKGKAKNFKDEFVDWVKGLLGMKGQTALDEFFQTSDRILTSANDAAKIMTYGEKYLERQGTLPLVARNQSERALGLMLSIQKGAKGQEVLDLLSAQHTISPAYVRAKQQMVSHFMQLDNDTVLSGRVLEETGFQPSPEGVDDFVNSTILGDVPNYEFAMDLFPEPVANYIIAKNHDYRQVLDVAAASTRKEVSQLLGMDDVSGVHNTTRETLAGLKKLQQFTTQHLQNVKDVQALSTLPVPDSFLDDAVVPAPFMQAVDGVGESAKHAGNWVEWFLRTPADYARTNPVLGEFFSKGYQLQSNARKFYSEAVRILGEDLTTGKATKEAVDESNKVLSNKKLLTATNKWLAANQFAAKQGKTGVSTLMSTDARVQGILKGLTPEEVSLVGNMVARAQGITQNVHASSLEKMEQIAVTRGAVIPLRDGTVKTVDQATKLSEAVFQAIGADRTDPAAAMKADQQLAWARGEMSPQAFLNLLEFQQKQVANYGDYASWYEQNPAWVTAQRQEKYLVRFKEGKRIKNLQASSRKEAMEIVKDHKGELIAIEDNFKGGDDEFPALGPEADALMAKLNERQESGIQMMLANGYINEAGAEYMRNTAGVATQFGREAGAQGNIPNFQPPARNLSQGAEDLPFMWNHMSWAERQANYWTRALFRAQADLHLQDPTINANEKYRELVKTHKDNLLQRDPGLAQKLQRFTTTWFMGFAPASAMVNATQSFVTHVAELTAMTGSPIQSYKQVAGAFGRLIDYYKGGRKWSNPDHEWLMHEATKAGERSYSMYDDEAAAQESIATNTKRLMMKTKPQTAGQRAGGLFDGVQKASMMMFKGIERLNNDAALLAGFDHYREQGLPREEALAKAFEFNHAVNFGGGRANRPIGIFSGRGDTLRTAGMFATALQSYVLGTTWQLTRYIKQGFFQPEGLTPHQKWASRKAAMQMLGTQFALAGTLGLPFVSGAIAVLEQAFPDLEINKNMRELFAGLMGEDDENGSVMQDIAMTGIPSMMGWDLQSRLSMGNTLPGTSEINGFQPQQLAGPTPNLIANFVQGGLKTLQGQMPWEFIPPGARKLAKDAVNGGQKDWKGRPLTGGLTPTEQVGVTLGFNPKRVSDFNAASRIATRADEIHNRREGQWRQQQATEILKGNFGNVRSALQERAQNEKDFDVRQAVRSITQASEELTYPRDLRNEGGKGRDSRLMSLFNLAQTGPTEEERLRFRMLVSQRLGLPTGLNRGDVQRAQLMDRLKAEKPDATRSELRRAVQISLRGSSASLESLD
jgi:hypothetical protein